MKTTALVIVHGKTETKEQRLVQRRQYLKLHSWLQELQPVEDSDGEDEEFLPEVAVLVEHCTTKDSLASALSRFRGSSSPTAPNVGSFASTASSLGAGTAHSVVGNLFVLIMADLEKRGIDKSFVLANGDKVTFAHFFGKMLGPELAPISTVILDTSVMSPSLFEKKSQREKVEGILKTAQEGSCCRQFLLSTPTEKDYSGTVAVEGALNGNPDEESAQFSFARATECVLISILHQGKAPGSSSGVHASGMDSLDPTTRQIKDHCDQLLATSFEVQKQVMKAQGSSRSPLRFEIQIYTNPELTSRWGRWWPIDEVGATELAQKRLLSFTEESLAAQLDVLPWLQSSTRPVKTAAPAPEVCSFKSPTITESQEPVGTGISPGDPSSLRTSGVSPTPSSTTTETKVSKTSLSATASAWTPQPQPPRMPDYSGMPQSYAYHPGYNPSAPPPPPPTEQQSSKKEKKKTISPTRQALNPAAQELLKEISLGGVVSGVQDTDSPNVRLQESTAPKQQQSDKEIKESVPTGRECYNIPSNREETLKLADEGVSDPYHLNRKWCVTCETEVCGAENWTFHVEGDKHKRRKLNLTHSLTTWEVDSLFDANGARKVVVPVGHYASPHTLESGEHYCPLCECQLPKTISWHHHISTEAHFRRVMETSTQVTRAQAQHLCRVCDVQVSGERNVQLHVDGGRHQRKLKAARVLCNTCGKEFPLREDLEDHRPKCDHQVNLPPYLMDQIRLAMHPTTSGEVDPQSSSGDDDSVQLHQDPTSGVTPVALDSGPRPQTTKEKEMSSEDVEKQYVGVFAQDL